jgi:hypothetical protein
MYDRLTLNLSNLKLNDHNPSPKRRGHERGYNIFNVEDLGKMTKIIDKTFF